MINHGRPPGGNVAALVGADIVRAGVVFTVRWLLLLWGSDLFQFNGHLLKPLLIIFNTYAMITLLIMWLTFNVASF